MGTEKMTKTIYTIGVVKWERGVIDVCADDTGRVHLRINNGRDEVVVNLSPEHALTAAQFIEAAATGRHIAL
jgi:hypothetical protein